jgi:hypothetical protein
MKYRKLDENYDYVFGRNDLDFINDINAVTQAIRTRVLLLRGEWWEDVEDGLPLFQSILEQRVTENGLLAADTAIMEAIMSTIGVTQIMSYKGEYDKKSRSYHAQAEIMTVYSSEPITFEVNI